MTARSRFFSLSLGAATVAAGSSAIVNILTGSPTRDTVVICGIILVAILLATAVIETARATTGRRRRAHQALHHLARNFVDRVEFRRRVAEGVPTSNTRSVRVEVISGPSGIGKTQVAHHYLLDVRGRVDLDLFVDARLPLDSIRAALSGWETEAHSWASEQVCNYLEQTRLRWILIFDDTDSWLSIRDLVPDSGRGQIVITTYDSTMFGQLPFSAIRKRHLKLSSLSIEDAARLLQKESGDSDDASAKLLASALGGYPLALRQAASYVANVPTQSLAKYYLSLRTRAPELFRRAGPPDYAFTVATVWSDAKVVIEERFPAALKLLAILSYLGDAEIPLPWILDLGVSQTFEEHDDPTVAIYELQRFSFVDYNKRRESLRVHILIRTVTRSYQGSRELQTEAIEVLDRAIRRKDHTAEAASHAFALLSDLVDTERVSSLPESMPLAANLSRLREERGDFFDAARALQYGLCLVDEDRAIPQMRIDARLRKTFKQHDFEADVPLHEQLAPNAPKVHPYDPHATKARILRLFLFGKHTFEAYMEVIGRLRTPRTFQTSPESQSFLSWLVDLGVTFRLFGLYGQMYGRWEYDTSREFTPSFGNVDGYIVELGQYVPDEQVLELLASMVEEAAWPFKPINSPRLFVAAGICHRYVTASAEKSDMGELGGRASQNLTLIRQDLENLRTSHAYVLEQEFSRLEMQQEVIDDP